MSTNSSAQQLKLSSIKPATYTWRINDFASQNSSSLPHDDYFHSIDKPEISFDLYLNTNAFLKNVDYVTIELHHGDKDLAKHSFRYHFAIINTKGEHCLIQDNFATLPVFTRRQTIPIGMYVINRSYLLDPVNDLLVNGALQIYCEVHFLDDQSKPAVPADKLLHEASKNFESLLENCNFSDVTLVVGTKELRAHKNVLSSRSPVFKAMFEHDCKEVNEGKVNITDVQVDAFEELLRYIYTGKVNVIKKYALELLVASDKYQMSSLKEYCEQYLIVNLSIDTSCETLLIADLLQVSQLKAKCIEFMNENVNAVIATDGWKRLADEKRFDLVTELYQNTATKIAK